ncbi:MAG TPA: EAL domain-containing protein [Methylophilaceae bacterium]|nr:EAL domain-containing protein [Methylophilaceae bacterium]
MTPPFFSRLRIQIPLAFVSLSAIVAILISADHQRDTAERIVSENRDMLQIMMLQLDGMIANDTFEESMLQGESRIPTTALHTNIRRLLLVDEQNQVLQASDSGWLGKAASAVSPYRPELALLAHKNQRGEILGNDEETLLYGYYPLPLGMQSSGASPRQRWGTLFVEYDLGEPLAHARRHAMEKAFRFLGLSLAAAILLGMLIDALVSRRTERLVSIASRIASGEMSARSGLVKPDEIGLLGQAIDRMADDLATDREALGRERKFSEDVIQSVTIPLFILDKDHRVIIWNRACEMLTGIKAIDIVGTTDAWRGFYSRPRPCLADLVLDGKSDQAGEYYQIVGASVFNAYSFHAESWFPKLNGQDRYLMFDATPIYGNDGKLIAVIENLQDITSIKKAEDHLRLTGQVIESTREAIVITDAENHIVSVNRAFTDVTGYSREDVLDRDPAMLASGRHDKAFFRNMWESLNVRDSWQGELWNRRKNGEIFPLWTNISSIRDNDGNLTHFVAIFADISEHKATLKHIEFLAHHDTLTKLPNRLLLLDRLQQAINLAEREKHRVALMFLDLDRFKQVNDSLGHHVGDDLLVAVVDRLKSCVRETDTISRQGGDEFVIVLPDIFDSNAATIIAEKILETLREPFVIDGHQLSTSFSIGISLYPDDGREIATLMQNADTAMYHAKESGRNNCHFYDESMNANAAERLKLQNKLRQAMEHGEFVLHYQPLISLQDHAIIGCEALLRWKSAEDGWVPPAKFIPLAEETGFILNIDAWVLREACRQAQEWVNAGLPQLTVAVNISALQFKRGRILDSVNEALAASGLDPTHLEIELTESVLIQDTQHTRKQLNQLNSLGVRLSIDDYGTGYSNLSYLKQLDVDKLKIDQSFVKDMLVDELDAIIVRSTVELAHNLGLQVLAEGVEDQDILTLLQDLGCDQAQGYHIGKPMPPREFEKLLRSKM